MAMAFIGRTLITKTNPNASLLPSIISRSFTARSLAVPSSSPLLRLRSLVTLTEFRRSPSIPSSLVGLRCFSTRQATSSLNDPSPNWNNRPPKETILLDGCDFEHWLIVMEKPEGEPTRDEIIDSYIKTAATVVGSEEEARKQIYSVSTRHYFAFGVIVSEEASYKFKELPRVRWVLPDSYLNVREKDYGGEPFINGEAVPYDPKYHEEWVRNNARANERSRRNDRPRNFDRSRNFERRRENMQSRDTQAPAGNPGQNMGGGMPAQNMQNSGPSMGGGRPAQNMQMPGPNMGGMPPNSNMPPASSNYGGMPPASPNYGGVPPNAPNYGGMPPNAPNYGGMPPSAPNYGGVPPSANMHNTVPNYGGMPPRDAGPNVGYSNNINRDARPNPGFSNIPNAGNPGNGNFQYRDAPGPMPNRDGPGPMPNRDYQNNYAPNGNTGGMPSGNAYQVRDIPGRDRDY